MYCVQLHALLSCIAALKKSKLLNSGASWVFYTNINSTPSYVIVQLNLNFNAMSARNFFYYTIKMILNHICWNIPYASFYFFSPIPSSIVITTDIGNGNYPCSSASVDIGQYRPDIAVLPGILIEKKPHIFAK